MTSIPEQMKRMQLFMDYQGKLRDLMVQAMPGTVSDDVVTELKTVVRGLEELLRTAESGDQFPPRDLLESSLADATEWVARAYDSQGNVEEADGWFARAEIKYAELNDAASVRRIRNKRAEATFHASQNIDEQLQHLMDRLERADPGTLEEAEVLLSLGELCSQAEDDFEARRYLERAQSILESVPNQLPSADDMLKALTGAVGGIQAGANADGGSPIEKATHLRGLHRRLYWALSNAYRTHDPVEAERYARRVAELDAERPSKAAGKALLDMLKDLG